MLINWRYKVKLKQENVNVQYRLDYHVNYTFKLYACVILLKYIEQNYQIDKNFSKLTSGRRDITTLSLVLWVHLSECGD